MKMTQSIVVEQLGKRYVVRHRRAAATDSLREEVPKVVKDIGHMLLQPLRWAKQGGGLPGGKVDYEEFWALRDVSFEVAAGERLGIIGRNGAGKSTLLKILSRITEPTTGYARIRGRTTSLLEVGTGFHPDLTGRENIFLNGAIMGMQRPEIIARFDEIVAFAEVEKFIDTPVKRYSSGMYMRLAFAVAAHLEPEVLIIDEVLAVGDAMFQKKCLGKMEEVSKQEGRIILFVSHNLGMISRLCDKSMLIDSGSIVEIGQTEKIVDRYMRVSSGNDQQSFKEFEKNKRVFSVNKVSMLNSDGVLSTKFSCDEEIVFRVNFEMRERIPGLYGYIALIKSSGEKVFVSDSFDPGENCLEFIGPGSYSLDIILPARTIGHGCYALTLDFASPQAESSSSRSISVESHINVLQFSVDDLRTIRGNNREGHLSTIPKWSIANDGRVVF